MKKSNPLKESFNSRTRGWLKIIAIDEHGVRNTLVDQKNTILANARDIVARLLAGEVDAKLDVIECYKAGAQLASSSTTATYVTTDTVQFLATFPPGSFSDTVDEVRLSSGARGTFSQVTGLSANKTLQMGLAVEWTLSINAI